MAETESAPVAAAPTKEKKTAKPKKSSSHPTYNVMIKEAISSLKEKGGSSRQAILKYVIKTHKVKADNMSGSQLKLALRRGVASGDLKQSKGTGASGSFKLGDSKKAEKPKTVLKKKLVKKPKTVKKAATPKKASKSSKKAKKPKVVRPVKKVAKSPKKVKKPAAKKVTKAKPKATKKARK